MNPGTEVVSEGGDKRERWRTVSRPGREPLALEAARRPAWLERRCSVTTAPTCATGRGACVIQEMDSAIEKRRYAIRASA